MVRFLCLMIPLLLSACGDSSNFSVISDSHITDTRNPVNTLSYSRDLISASTRLPAYSKIAGRASLINPDIQAEVWHAEATGYKYGYALSDLSGLTLVSDTAVEVITQSARKKFEISGKYFYSTAAANHATYALIRQDLHGFDVIHSLGNANWQFTTLNFPWTAPEAEPENSTAVIVNPQGTKIIAFSMYDGSYSIITSEGLDKEISSVPFTCPGVPRLADKAFLYTSIAWNEVKNALLVGNDNGLIRVVDPALSCQPPESWPSVSIASGVEILSMVVDKKGDIRALLKNGTIWTFQTISGSFTIPQKSLSVPCRTSGTMLPIATDNLLLVCAIENSLGSRISQFFNIPSITLQYLTYNLNSTSLISSFSLLLEESAGTGINPETGIMYRLKDGSLGELEIYNMLSGEHSAKQGLFLQGLLDSL